MPSDSLTERVLVVAPFGRDAQVAATMLESSHIATHVCPDLAAACAEMQIGAGALVLTTEAMTPQTFPALLTWLTEQPPWSDIPIVVYARPSDSADNKALRALERFNVSFAERPLRVLAFLSTIRAALRARKRQYEVRDLLDQTARDAEERTELLQREQFARNQAESASRAKDEFLAMLGHELRNPLSPIMTVTHLLLLRGEENYKREFAIIDRQVKHLARLVDDLLDVSRIARGKIDLRIERVELSEVVARAVEMAAPLIEQRQHQLVLDVPKSGLLVAGDRARLAQVIANLLTNAAKYMEKQGCIVVCGKRQDEQIVVRVQDTGIGITAAMLPRVFDLFAQERQELDRSQGGLGLGLAIVRNLVELHGGQVTAKSDGAGQGSEFTVSLPVAQRESVLPQVPSITSPALPAVPAIPLRLMIVDDNEDAAELLSHALSLMGYDTRVANDGPSALKLADEFLPEIALLDIGLPLMDGFELGQKLRSRPALKDLCLVAVTGYGQPTDIKKTRAAGFDEHMVKPVNLTQLEVLLRRLLSEKKKPSQPPA